jgi:DNA polymerase
MAHNDEADDATELGDLAHALSRTARRRQSLGARPKRSRPSSAAPETKPAPAAARANPAPQRVSPAGPARVAERTVERSRPPARSARDVQEQAAAATTLDELRARVAVCEACALCQTRTQTVFMDGAAVRGVLFVGEAPGAEEDRTGVPFVGRSGQLLTDIITKGMGIPRPEVAIANVLKCRPPENRDPTPAEKTTCTPWLDRQIELIDPRVIIPLGRHAANHVLGTQDAAMGALRQKIHEKGGRKIVPTFHPSYLLRSPGEKKECWKDIQLAMGILGLDPKKSP